MRVLVTGAAGGLGRLVCARLLGDGHEVVGVDRRGWARPTAGMQFVHSSLRPRDAEALFVQARPQALVLLGGLRAAPEEQGTATLHAVENLLRLCVAHGVHRLVLLSSGDVYGPSPTNSHFLAEDAPLRASQRFPAVRGLVAVDRTIQAFGCRHPAVRCVTLRPAHIVGTHLRNAASNYLRLPRVPTQMGFDPMLQLTGEQDACRALSRCLSRPVRGAFNLASSQPVPLSVLLRLLNKPTLPIPHPLFARGLGKLWRLGLTSFPPPELDHIRFNSVLDTERAKAELDIAPDAALEDLLRPFTVVSSSSPPH